MYHNRRLEHEVGGCFLVIIRICFFFFLAAIGLEAYAASQAPQMDVIRQMEEMAKPLSLVQFLGLKRGDFSDLLGRADPAYAALRESSSPDKVRRLQEIEKSYIQFIRKVSRSEKGVFGSKIVFPAEITRSFDIFHAHKDIGQGSPVLLLETKPEESIHAAMVEDVLKQVAPGAIVTIQDSDNLSEKRIGLPDKGIVNASYNSSTDESNRKFLKFVQSLGDHLAIRAAGNREKKLVQEYGRDESLWEDLLRALPQLIFAVNINKDNTLYRGDSGSGFPGSVDDVTDYCASKKRPDLAYEVRLVQEATLSVPGVNVLMTIQDQKGGHRIDTGTSLSAPVVSGAAALIMAYRSFLGANPLSANDIRRCLLLGADKEFIIGSGNNSVLIYDPSQRRPESSLKTVEFNPAIYGAGIINLERSKACADFLQNNPHASDEEIKEFLARRDTLQRTSARNVIKRVWRSHRTPHGQEDSPLSNCKTLGGCISSLEQLSKLTGLPLLKEIKRLESRTQTPGIKMYQEFSREITQKLAYGPILSKLTPEAIKNLNIDSDVSRGWGGPLDFKLIGILKIIKRKCPAPSCQQALDQAEKIYYGVGPLPHITLSQALNQVFESLPEEWKKR